MSKYVVMLGCNKNGKMFSKITNSKLFFELNFSKKLFKTKNQIFIFYSIMMMIDDWLRMENILKFHPISDKEEKVRQKIVNQILIIKIKHYPNCSSCL